MTEKEIIKALELCKLYQQPACDECPFFSREGMCIEKKSKEALDLIKKLKNREKRYQKKIKFQRSALKRQQEQIKTARAEAIKEFAEQVKMTFYYEFDEIIPSHMADKIDDLVKEMVGDGNDL